MLDNVYKVWSREQMFPRELSLGRKIITNEEDFTKLKSSTDEYLSVFNMKQMFYETYDTIFFDIDGKTGGTNEAIAKYMKFKQNYNFISRLYFSGVGLHVYTDLVTPIRGKAEYKQFCNKLVKKYNLIGLIDSSAVGDTSRLARLPHSVNSRSGKTTIQILDSELIKKPEEYVETIYAGKKYVLVDFGIEIEERKQEKSQLVKLTKDWKKVYGDYPPCINNALNMIEKEGELNHTERIHLATFLINIGREDELWEALKKANDYSESISIYQVEYLKSRNMKSYSCANVEDDICSYAGNKKLCPFYPSVNIFINKLGENK